MIEVKLCKIHQFLKFKIKNRRKNRSNFIVIVGTFLLFLNVKIGFFVSFFTNRILKIGTRNSRKLKKTEENYVKFFSGFSYF